jgi:hypothetical protein
MIHRQKASQGVYVTDAEPVMDPASPLGGEEVLVLPLGGDSPKEGIANVGFHMLNPVWLLIPRNVLGALRYWCG